MDELTLFDVADDGTIIYHDEADDEEILDGCADGGSCQSCSCGDEW